MIESAQGAKGPPLATEKVIVERKVFYCFGSAGMSCLG
jgi:hypothetical protein